MTQSILFVAAEGLPYVKSGGLADVIGSLPKELKKSGADIRVVLPLYKQMAIKDHGRFEFVVSYDVNAGNIHTMANIYKETVDGVIFYFVEHQALFERDNLYGYGDDAYRFGFFQHAVCRLLEAINFFPDVIHTHDWHTAAIPFLCRTFYSYREEFRRLKHVFTIHNLAFQGVFPEHELWASLGMDYGYFLDGTARFYSDQISYMKLGILYADKVTTVSATYAQEILTEEFGENMQNVLGLRYEDLSGIVNGIDYDVWDSAIDKSLVKTYDLDQLEGKLENKLALQARFNLPQDKDTILVGVVSRLTWQKGFYLMVEKLPEMLQAKVQFIVLGNGEANIENAFNYYQATYPDQFAFFQGYNEELAHQIYAASDLFFMPSMFEPCGISQLIAMHYGSLPLVRETGGLKDTVQPYNQFNQEGTGFIFTGKSADAMRMVFDYALDTYYNRPDHWQTLVKNAMSKDVSWTASALAYQHLYQSILD